MLMPTAYPHQHPYSTATTAPTSDTTLSGYEMNGAMTALPPQSHINKLLHTAAAGNGVVEDVDALLTPIPRPSATGRYEYRPERNLWRIDEIMEMLRVMQETNALELLNDKTVKSEKIFRSVEEVMHKNGFIKKSHVQIWTKWKFLKSTYTTSKRNGTMPKMIPPVIYDVLHRMLESGGTSDCGTSTNSLDGDNSNGGHLVISGVEGGYHDAANGGEPTTTGTGTDGVGTGIGTGTGTGTGVGVGGCAGGDIGGGIAGQDSADEESAFGMAHPIFGFRLGLVKQEPVDTGYETLHNEDPATASTRLPLTAHESSTANIHFQTVIKKEIEEQPTDTIPLRLPTEPMRPRRPRQVPAKYSSSPCHSPAPLPLVLPLPLPLPLPMPLPQPQQKTTPSKKDGSSAVGQSQLPPLRIAPFAKVPPHDAANGLLKLLECPPPPPPPLSQCPAANTTTTSRLRLNNNSNNNNNNNSSSNNNNIQRRLLSKLNAQSPHVVAGQQIRLPKDITIQTRGSNVAADASTNGNGVMPRPKQVPMRKMPYSAQHDHALPLMDVQFAQQQQQQQKQLQLQQQHKYENFHEAPTSSKLLGDPLQQLQYAEATHRMPLAMIKTKGKRRLNIPVSRGPTMKMPRTYTPTQGYRDNAKDYAKRHRSAHGTTVRTTPEKGQQPDNVEQDKEQEEEDNFEDALKELSTSLREMQREMINDFFNQQMEMARKEHEFQMQQDMLIMQAFQQQSNDLVEAAKLLLGDELAEGNEAGGGVGQQEDNVDAATLQGDCLQQGSAEAEAEDEPEDQAVMLVGEEPVAASMEVESAQAQADEQTANEVAMMDEQQHAYEVHEYMQALQHEHELEHEQGSQTATMNSTMDDPTGGGDDMAVQPEVQCQADSSSDSSDDSDDEDDDDDDEDDDEDDEDDDDDDEDDDDDDEDDDDEDDEAGNQNIVDDNVENNDSITDPIQLVSSELVEEN